VTRWGGRRHKWRKTGVPIRPIRWLNASDDADDVGACGIDYHTTTCEDPSAVELLPPSSWSFTDRQEPTLERIVGSIHVAFAVQTNAYPNVGPTRPLFRCGILVVTDDPSLASYTIPSPFAATRLLEEQWMWLHQNGEWNAPSPIPTGGGPSILALFGGVDLPVDIRVKRKLSQDSHLLLVHQYKLEATAAWTGVVGLNSMLRCILKS